SKLRRNVIGQYAGKKNRKKAPERCRDSGQKHLFTLRISITMFLEPAPMFVSLKQIRPWFSPVNKETQWQPRKKPAQKDRLQARILSRRESCGRRCRRRCTNSSITS